MEHATSSDLSAGERGGSAVQTAIAGALAEGALFLAPILVVVAVWQAATMWLQTPVYLLPSPIAVAQAAWRLLSDGTLVEYLVASVGRLFIGTVLAFAIAVPLGYAVGVSRTADRMFSPIISVAQPIPGIAWIPLAILWFGLGPMAVGFIIFLAAFFPIALNTVTGVRTISRDLVRVARVFHLPPRMVLLDVVIPGALPYIVTGTRLGFGYAWRALVAGEMIAATSGLGYMIFQARDYLKTDEVIVGMLTIGLFWAAIERLVLRPIERRTIERWGLAAPAA